MSLIFISDSQDTKITAIKNKKNKNMIFFIRLIHICKNTEEPSLDIKRITPYH
jgi:hypothetical protein